MPPFVTIDRETKNNAVLKIVGVGGGGCNALNSMISRGLTGIEYIAINTDAQCLETNNSNHKLVVGSKITEGLGAGADPTIGRKATEEDRDKISDLIRGSNMLFLTAGMGGGTGTGGLPVVASIAKSLDILTVAIVTKPFRWEGKQRMTNAEKGIQELRQYVDSLIVIPNDRLLAITGGSMDAFQSLEKANEVLYEATRGIADIINVGGYINVDFADVRSVMQGSGKALMGCGIASGENRAIEAAQKAISSPFLEGMNIKGAKSVLVNVTASSSMSLKEFTEGNDVIFNAAGEETNVILGCVKKETMNDYISYTVIATGFEEKASARPKPPVVIPGKPVQQPVREPRIIRPIDISDSEKDNTEIPAYYRLNSPQTKLEFNEEDEEVVPDQDFGFDKFKSASLEQTKTNEIAPQKQKDDSSEAFFRMLMD